MEIVDNLTKVLRSFLSKNAILILIVAVIFLSVSVYVYKNYISPRITPSYVANKEFIDDGENVQDEAELLFFYTDWCPHCKKAKPIWEELKNTYDNNVINNTKVAFIDVDCDKEEALADKYQVEGYPTIKLAYKGQVIEYDAKPDLETLKDFLHSTL